MGDSYATISNWPNRCGDGRIDTIIEDFEIPSRWSFCCSGPGVPAPTLTKAEGCSGAALAIGYDLTDGTLNDGWLVIRRYFESPVDLRGYTHLRIALRGSDLNAHHNFQIKLVDAQDRIYWVVAESTIDLPIWRAIYVDLREFTCVSDETTCEHYPSLDPSAITRIEIAIARCVKIREDGKNEECEPGSDKAVFYLDELAAVDLRPGAKHRLVQKNFKRVVPNPDRRASTAKAIRDHQDNHGLVPAWFEERDPNYNTYIEALSLLVFVNEYQQTEDHTYKKAARRLASKLLTIQIPGGKVNAGAWYTAYKLDGDQVVPSDSTCTGDEKSLQEVNRCSWIGNTAWAVIALDQLKNSGIYNNPTGLKASIVMAASWMVKQIGRITGYPDL